MALDRAIHIINTSTPTRLDFRGLAVEIAKRLCVEKVVHGWDNGFKFPVKVVDDVLEPGAYEGETIVEVEPKPLQASQIRELDRAAKRGGAEFLALVIDACDSVSAPHRHDLPDAIDPAAVAESINGEEDALRKCRDCLPIRKPTNY